MSRTPEDAPRDPVVIPRPEHCISRRDIDNDALNVLYRLHKNGYRAYLVGGGVRDLLVGKRPKDFDIVTNARPGRIKKIFSRNCRIIGRRFRLAHIHYGHDKIIEVATFRSSPENDAIERDGEMIRRDNVYGTPREDAYRRDLTINGLFYDISDFSVIDYVGGVEDLRKGVIRMIRDPKESFREDPVRMLRAIRHATRLDFEIDEGTERAIRSEREEILKCNAARLLEELYKDLSAGCARAFFEELHRYRFLKILAPALAKEFTKRGKRRGKALFLESLDRLDELGAQGAEITHAVALSALFSPLILEAARTLEENPPKQVGRQIAAFQKALTPALKNLRIYKRDAERLWEVLGAWVRLADAYETGSIPKPLRRAHFFPEAIEVFGLLEESSEELDEFLERCRASVEPVRESDEDHRRGRGGRRGGGGGDGGAESGGEGRRTQGGKRSGQRGGKRRRGAGRGARRDD